MSITTIPVTLSTLAARKYGPKFGLCFDWETSGSFQDPKTLRFDSKHQGLSLGLIVFEMETLNKVDTLYVEMKFEESKYEWSSEAEAIHGLSKEHLEENGLSKEDAIIAVVEFLLKWFGPDPIIDCMAHNIKYDIDFMEQLLEEDGLMFKIRDRKMDTSALSFICFSTNRSKELFDITGLADRTTHNALEDAEMTLEACRRIRQLINSALYD